VSILLLLDQRYPRTLSVAGGLPSGETFGSPIAAPVVSRRWTAEGGADGATVTIANSGGGSGDPLDDALAGAGATLAYRASQAARGTRSVEIATGGSSAQTYMAWVFSPTSILYGRFYIRPTGTPPSLTTIFSFRSVSTVRALIQMTTSGQIRVSDANLATVTTSTTTLPLGQWSRIEFRIVFSAAAGRTEVALYTGAVDAFTPTETNSSGVVNTGGSIDRAIFGFPTPQANLPSTFLDDIDVNTSGYPGPSPLVLAPAGIGTATTVPGPALSTGPVSISPAGLPSGETFGALLASWSRAENTFEGGAAGATITVGGTGSGRPWDATSISGTGSAVWDATRAAHGFLSGRFVTTSSDVAYVMWTSVVSAPTVYARIYLYVDAYPPGNTNILRLMSGASTIVGTVRIASTGKIGYFYGSTFATATAAPVTLGRWVRIEARYTASTTAGSATIRVYDNVDPDSIELTEQLSSTDVNTATNSNIDRLRAGIVASGTMPGGLWIDDVAWSDTGWLGAATGPKVLIPGAATSAEAFGTPALTAGAAAVLPAGIPSAAAVGAATLSTAVAVTAQPAASAEAFGSPAVTPGAVILAAAGVAGAEAVGLPAVTTGGISVAPAAIGSAEIHGTGALTTGPAALVPVGIASAGAFGASTVTTGAVTVAPAATGTGFAAGVPELTVQSAGPYLHGGHLVIPMLAGLSGTESEQLYALAGSRVETHIAQLPNAGNGTTTMMLRFAAQAGVDELSVAWRGDGVIAFTAITAGVTDETTVAYNATWTRWRIFASGGTVSFAVSPDGITWTTHRTVAMPGWANAGRISLLAGYTGTETDPGQARFEVINPPLLAQNLAPAAVGTAEAHGAATVAVGGITAAPAGIATAEAFGSPTLATGVVLAAPAAISTSEAFGAAVVSTGPVQVFVPGIGTGQGLGEPGVVAGPLGLHPAGIGTGEAVGAPAVWVGQVGIIPIDIASSEDVPSPSIGVAGVPIQVVGADSAEVFGSVKLGLFARPASIETAETVPAPRVGGKWIDAEPIGSLEAFGVPALLWTPSSGDLPDGGRAQVGGDLLGRVAAGGRLVGRAALSGSGTGGRAAASGSPPSRSAVRNTDPGRLAPARR
jgi:hypothetical protein